MSTFSQNENSPKTEGKLAPPGPQRMSLFANFNQRRTSHSKSQISSRRSSYRGGSVVSSQNSQNQKEKFRSSIVRSNPRKLSHNPRASISHFENFSSIEKKKEEEKFDKKLSDFKIISNLKKNSIQSEARKSILNEIYSPRLSQFKKKRIELLDKVK